MATLDVMAPGFDPSGRRLLIAGVAVSGLAAAAYLAALLTHPASALIDGYDLRVYLDGGTVARHWPADLYRWHYRDTPGIQFLYTPFAAMIFAALTFVPWRVLNDVTTAADVAAVVVTVWIAFRELGWPDRARRPGATLLVSGPACWIEPVQRVLFPGQVELLLMVLVIWDMPAARPAAVAGGSCPAWPCWWPPGCGLPAGRPGWRGPAPRCRWSAASSSRPAACQAAASDLTCTGT